MVVENIALIMISLIISGSNIVRTQNFEGYVVEGDYAAIREFPHAALLSIECKNEQNELFFTCGSSILNQAILITAAHCLEHCDPKYTSVVAFVGHEEVMMGSPYLSSSFKMHENYDTDSICNDIALVRLKETLKFGKGVRRVSLMSNPPYNEVAKVAGWGFIDGNNELSAQYLMDTNQRVWSREECMEMLGEKTPKGSICGGEMQSSSYVAPGDSGSGLMVRKYIQVGVVSYKNPEVSNSLVVYTEIAYFYNWIKKNAKKMYCG